MDRQNNYEPRPEIARMKSFNADDGFYSYQAKWSIGKLPAIPDDEHIGSKYFTMNDGPEEQEWKLRFYYISEESDISKVSITRICYSNDDDEIPVLARMKVLNETKGINEYSSTASFLVAGYSWSHDWKIPDDIANAISKEDNYVVHCWVDIPKKYDGTTSNIRPNSDTALLASSIARSLDKITIKNGDPTSDIELVIKDDDYANSDEPPPRFYCHRVILANRSPVFETMFTNDRFKENNERIVEIEDTDVNTLKLVLEYTYTGQIGRRLRDDTNKQSIISLLNAAEKYMLPELKDECALALIGFGNGDCDDDGWIEYLQLAETFHLDYLKKICILALSTNMRSLKDQYVREKISPSVMAELLELVTKRGEVTTKVIAVKTE